MSSLHISSTAPRVPIQRICLTYSGLEDRELATPHTARDRAARPWPDITSYLRRLRARRKADEIHRFDASTWSNDLGFTAGVKRIPWFDLRRSNESRCATASSSTNDARPIVRSRLLAIRAGRWGDGVVDGTPASKRAERRAALTHGGSEQLRLAAGLPYAGTIDLLAELMGFRRPPVGLVATAAATPGAELLHDEIGVINDEQVVLFAVPD